MSQPLMNEPKEESMKIRGRKIRWQLYAMYTLLAAVCFIAFAPIVLHLDQASNPYTNERATFAWMVAQRHCKVVEGKDTTWYGRWATWKCLDGSSHVSKFGSAEIQSFLDSQRSNIGEPVFDRAPEDDGSVIGRLMEFIRSTFRVNLNTFLLLCILVQVSMIHYKLR